MRAVTQLVYDLERCPPCVVLHDGRWHAGEVRMWQLETDGWWGTVQFLTEPDKAYMQRLPEQRIRTFDSDDDDWA